MQNANLPGYVKAALVNGRTFITSMDNPRRRETDRMRVFTTRRFGVEPLRSVVEVTEIQTHAHKPSTVVHVWEYNLVTWSTVQKS